MTLLTHAFAAALTGAATGRVVGGELDHPTVDDLLDDLGEMVATKGGRVWVVPAEHMPAQSGLAASFRY
jgi:hypothetical protein